MTILILSHFVFCTRAVWPCNIHELRPIQWHNSWKLTAILAVIQHSQLWQRYKKLRYFKITQKYTYLYKNLCNEIAKLFCFSLEVQSRRVPYSQLQLECQFIGCSYTVPLRYAFCCFSIFIILGFKLFGYIKLIVVSVLIYYKVWRERCCRLL